jgi:hypothetical protein
MKYIKRFFFFLSLPAVIACGSDGKYSADSGLACYSPKSAIYNADSYNAYSGGVSRTTYNADSYNAYSGGVSRTTAALWEVKFFNDNGIEIPEFQVSVDDGNYITLPDIRVKHCFLTYGKEGKILAGWKDVSYNYAPGSSYKVTGAANLTAVWGEGKEIYSAAEFYNNISDNLTGTYKLARQIDLSDYTGGTEWTPIGSADKPFKGKLYGNGNTIDNLTIASSSTGDAGLFGAIGGSAEIYDLKINLAADGIKLTASDTNKAVGVLAGYIKYGDGSNIIIKNVRTSGGAIKADNCSTDGYLYAGGLVGRVEAASSYSSGAHIIFDNVSNRSPISAAVSVNSCNASLGGIIGGTDLTDATASLISAENYGAIDFLKTTTSKVLNVYAGGFIGRGDNTTVEAGANRGVVTAESSAGYSSYSGGIVGYMTVGGSIKNSHNYVNVTARSVSSALPSDLPSFAGGIAGYTGNPMTIEGSSNSGDILSETDNNSYAGGIAGRMTDGSVVNSRNDGGVNAKIFTNAVVYDFYTYSGGIAGQMSGGGSITDSRNNGGVLAEAATDKSDVLCSHSYSGGIVGSIDNGSIINSHNRNDVMLINQFNCNAATSYAGG